MPRVVLVFPEAEPLVRSLPCFLSLIPVWLPAPKQELFVPGSKVESASGDRQSFNQATRHRHRCRVSLQTSLRCFVGVLGATQKLADDGVLIIV